MKKIFIVTIIVFIYSCKEEKSNFFMVNNDVGIILNKNFNLDTTFYTFGGVDKIFIGENNERLSISYALNRYKLENEKLKAWHHLDSLEIKYFHLSNPEYKVIISPLKDDLLTHGYEYEDNNIYGIKGYVQFYGDTFVVDYSMLKTNATKDDFRIKYMDMISTLYLK